MDECCTIDDCRNMDDCCNVLGEMLSLDAPLSLHVTADVGCQAMEIDPLNEAMMAILHYNRAAAGSKIGACAFIRCCVVIEVNFQTDAAVCSSGLFCNAPCTVQ